MQLPSFNPKREKTGNYVFENVQLLFYIFQIKLSFVSFSLEESTS